MLQPCIFWYLTQKYVRNFTLVKRSLSLSYKIVGEGSSESSNVPPVFLLHGLLGQKIHWDGMGQYIFIGGSHV